MATAKLVSTAILQYYDTKLKAWVSNQVTGAVAALGDVLTLKGRVNDLSALNAISDPKDGDVYLVGPEASPEYEEYYYYNSAWEYMGTTAVSLDGYVTETALYKGDQGTGTTSAPAAGTILAPIVAAATALTARVTANEEAITAINDSNSGILATAKGYTDTQVGAVDAKVTTNTNAIAAINNESTGILAVSKSYTDTEVKKVDDKVTANTAAIEAINNVDTGILASAKSYSDTKVAAVEAKVDSVAEESDIDALFA